MCGIAGFLSTAGPRGREELHQLVERMTSTMLHRGPDASGIWVCPLARMALGHRRLSIIDTSEAGTQPMASSDGRYVISFNGEIYNFLELRPILEGKGAIFRTRTDTEVLIEAMRHWGPEGLLQLDGMFAFALHDTVTGETILGRDAFGEKPLYYVANEKRFAFASELQALQTLPDFDFSVPADAVAEYLCFQYIGAPRTLYREAKKLPPGHFMRLSPDGRMQLQRYFEFRPASSESGELRPLGELAEECEEILVRSLRRRLISDVPLGAFLSGGVDSSTVVALATRALGRSMKTFSIGFEGSPDSEHEIAREFARHLGTEHREEIFQPNQTEMAEQIGRMLDEPNGDTSCAPTYLLCGMARKHVTVAISGDGGDELFLGYRRHLHMLEQRRLFESNQQLEWTLGSGYYSDQILVFCEGDIRRLLGYVPEPLRARLGGLRRELDSQGSRAIDILRQTDVENYMPGAVLAKVDRMSMQHSLEVRTPFLSIELARFAERLPPDALQREGVGKMILRTIAKKYLPAHLIDLPKKGFGLPMAEWARESLMSRFDRHFRQPASPLSDIIPETAVERFAQRQPAAFAPYQVWALSVLGHYCESHKVRFTAEPPALGELTRRGTDLQALPLLADLRRRAHPVLLLCADELPVWFASLPAGSVIVSRWPGKNPEGLPLRYIQCAWDTPGALTGIFSSLGHEHLPRVGVVYGGIAEGDREFFSQLTALIQAAARLAPKIDYCCYYSPSDFLIVRCQRFLSASWNSGRDQGALRRFVETFLLHLSATLGRNCPPGRALRRFAKTLGLHLCALLLSRKRRKVQRAIEGAIQNAPIESRGDLLPAWKFTKKGDAVFAYNEELPADEKTREHDLLEDGRSVERAAAETQRSIEVALAAGSQPGIKPAVHATTWAIVQNRLVIVTPDPISLENGLHEYHLARTTRLHSFFARFLERRPRWGMWHSRHRPPNADGVAQWRFFGAALTDFIRLDNEERSRRDHFVPRKVMMVSWALSSGGAERQFAICASRLRQMGVDVAAYTLMPLTGYLAHYLPLLREGGVPVFAITSPCEQFAFDSPLGGTPLDQAALRALSLLPEDICSQVWNLYTHYTVERPQAVYAQMDWPGICSAVAAILAGVPCAVISFRGMSPERTPHWGSSTDWVRQSHLMLQRSKRVVLSGNSQAGNDDYARWLGIPPSDVILVRNGLETASLDAAQTPEASQRLRDELGIAPGEKVLLGVFRLDPEKRPSLFIELAAKLLAKVPELVVLHAGGGTERERCEKEVQALGLGRRLRLLGRRSDPYPLLKMASVVCLTSEFEGTPNVLLEAQYLETPVVAFSVGGVPEAVAEGKSGFVLKDGDNAGWLGACLRLLTDESLRQRMGAAGKAFVTEAYSVDKSCERLLATMRIV